VPPPSGSKGLQRLWPPDSKLGGNNFLQFVANYLPIGMMSHYKELKYKQQLCKNVTTCCLSDKIIHPIADIQDPSKKLSLECGLNRYSL